MKNNLLSRFVFRSIVLSIGESCLMRKTIIEIDVVHFKLDKVGLKKLQENFEVVDYFYLLFKET